MPRQVEMRRVPCKTCRRNFVEDRIETHQSICQSVTRNLKKRTQFNSLRARTKGTDMEPFIQRGLHQKPDPKACCERRPHKDTSSCLFVHSSTKKKAWASNLDYDDRTFIDNPKIVRHRAAGETEDVILSPSTPTTRPTTPTNPHQLHYCRPKSGKTMLAVPEIIVRPPTARHEAPSSGHSLRNRPNTGRPAQRKDNSIPVQYRDSAESNTEDEAGSLINEPMYNAWNFGPLNAKPDKETVVEKEKCCKEIVKRYSTNSRNNSDEFVSCTDVIGKHSSKIQPPMSVKATVKTIKPAEPHMNVYQSKVTKNNQDILVSDVEQFEPGFAPVAKVSKQSLVIQHQQQKKSETHSNTQDNRSHRQVSFVSEKGVSLAEPKIRPKSALRGPRQVNIGENRQPSNNIHDSRHRSPVRPETPQHRLRRSPTPTKPAPKPTELQKHESNNTVIQNFINTDPLRHESVVNVLFAEEKPTVSSTRDKDMPVLRRKTDKSKAHKTPDKYQPKQYNTTKPVYAEGVSKVEHSTKTVADILQPIQTKLPPQHIPTVPLQQDLDETVHISNKLNLPYKNTNPVSSPISLSPRPQQPRSPSPRYLNVRSPSPRSAVTRTPSPRSISNYSSPKPTRVPSPAHKQTRTALLRMQATEKALAERKQLLLKPKISPRDVRARPKTTKTRPKEDLKQTSSTRAQTAVLKSPRFSANTLRQSPLNSKTIQPLSQLSPYVARPNYQYRERNSIDVPRFTSPTKKPTPTTSPTRSRQPTKPKTKPKVKKVSRKSSRHSTKSNKSNKSTKSGGKKAKRQRKSHYYSDTKLSLQRRMETMAEIKRKNTTQPRNITSPYKYPDKHTVSPTSL